MKYLLIVLLLCLSSLTLAKDYTCYKSDYAIEIELTNDRSTHLSLTNRYQYHNYVNAYAGSIDRGNRVTSFYFYSSEEPVILSFVNSAIEEQANAIRVHIDAFIDGFILKGYADCVADK